MALVDRGGVRSEPVGVDDAYPTLGHAQGRDPGQPSERTVDRDPANPERARQVFLRPVPVAGGEQPPGHPGDGWQGCCVGE
jgi:hypothetical protein